MIDNQQLLDIVAGLYDAALDESRWPEVMKCICDHTESRDMAILLLDHSTGLVPLFMSTVGLPEDFKVEYSTHMAQHDPRVHYIQTHPEAILLYDYLHTPESEIDRHPYYD